MCYDTKSGLKMSIKYAKHRGDDAAAIAELERQLELFSDGFEKHFYASGFAHPKLMVFTNDKPFVPQAFVWGLIPHWVKDKQTAHTIWNQTLNAKCETLFEKPAFKLSAIHKRCIIYLDAFYEHHHAHSKTYPYHIAMKDASPLAIAGLWDEWANKETGEIVNTCTIITTIGNSTMTKIHNNPKLDGARMPVIIPKHKQNNWLMDCNNEADMKSLTDLLIPFDDELLETYTVKQLKGKSGVGNSQEAEKEFVYQELNETNTLF